MKTGLPDGLGRGESFSKRAAARSWEPGDVPPGKTAPGGKRGLILVPAGKLDDRKESH